MVVVMRCTRAFAPVFRRLRLPPRHGTLSGSKLRDLDPIMTETAPFMEKFERFEKEAKQPPWLFPLRKAGISRFAEQGFPTINDEDWRFTNVAPITKLPFNPVFEGGQDGISAKT